MMDYRHKVILAPMVRVGTLPMRLLALEFGADLVYCEEIIDFKILSAKRTVNELLGTVDYVLSDESVVFRTCPAEKSRLVFQLGTADAKRALMAAKKLQNDVSGLDINMGCPKEFSIKGGMGAALLTQPDKIKEILTTLVSGLSIPVTCKIRVLPELEDTLKLVKLIESTGVSAIAVHGRTKEERSQHANRNDVIKCISEAVSIPVIANGGSRNIVNFDQIKSFWNEVGTSSVMIARAAEWNVSVFRQEGPLQVFDVIKKYLKYAADYDNHPINTKYCILQMMKDSMKEPEGPPMLAVATMEEIYDIWGMKEFYAEVLRKREQKAERLKSEKGKAEHETSIKRRKTEDGSILYELPVRFVKKDYPVSVTPKQRLHDLCRRNREPAPHYNTVVRPGDRYFNSVLTFRGCKYTTPFWEKSKPIAEQGAAIACMISLGEDDGRLQETKQEGENLRRKWIQLQKSRESLSVTDKSDDACADNGLGIIQCTSFESENTTSKCENNSNCEKRNSKFDTIASKCEECALKCENNTSKFEHSAQQKFENGSPDNKAVLQCEYFKDSNDSSHKTRDTDT